MDNPEIAFLSNRVQSSSRGFFSRKKNKSGFSLSSRWQFDDDVYEDDQESRLSQESRNNSTDSGASWTSAIFGEADSNHTYTSPPKHGRKQTKDEHRHSLRKFTKRVTMTPFDTENNFMKKNSSIPPLSRFKQATSRSKFLMDPETKMAHLRETERWSTLKSLNMDARPNDPLIHSQERLNTFLDYYDSILRDEPTELHQSENAVLYWSISALKFLSGVNHFVTDNVLTEFGNFDLKKDDKIRCLKLFDRDLSVEWTWQFAIDNPAAEVYSFSTEPVLYDSIQQERTGEVSAFGPSNYHPVHGTSPLDLPFAKESFSFALAYNLVFELKEEEWRPALSELHRVLQSQGTLNLFLVDFKPVNCTNEKYNNFFARLREFLVKKGIDPMPCRKAQSRLKDAGFEDIKYSFLAMKKGIPNRMGMAMELLQEYMESVFFQRMAKLAMSEEEVQEFKELKLRYHEDLRNGNFVEEFGDMYYMFAFGRKP